MQRILDRFLKYVQVDTQSDPNNPAFPSTEKQWDLARILVAELENIGMQEVELDKNCYLMATLPSNVSKEVPTIGFVAHMDTSPDFSGTDVRPQIHRNYDGKALVLNRAQNVVLSPDYFEDLLLYKGQTLITTDGTTLLGADDKAGINGRIGCFDHDAFNQGLFALEQVDAVFGIMLYKRSVAQHIVPYEVAKNTHLFFRDFRFVRF